MYIYMNWNIWTLNLKVCLVYEIKCTICKSHFDHLEWSEVIDTGSHSQLRPAIQSTGTFRGRKEVFWNFRLDRRLGGVCGLLRVVFFGWNVDSLKSNLSWVKAGQCWVSFKIWPLAFGILDLYHISLSLSISWTQTRGHLGMKPGLCVCALPRDQRCQSPVKFLSSFSKWQWIWVPWDHLMTPWERSGILEWKEWKVSVCKRFHFVKGEWQCCYMLLLYIINISMLIMLDACLINFIYFPLAKHLP